MDPMSLFRDDGVVLRTQKLGEADRIITLLTRGHGRGRAVARGGRRGKAKFGGGGGAAEQGGVRGAGGALSRMWICISSPAAAISSAAVFRCAHRARRSLRTVA